MQTHEAILEIIFGIRFFGDIPDCRSWTNPGEILSETLGWFRGGIYEEIAGKNPGRISWETWDRVQGETSVGILGVISERVL